jgi:hypothetical protein
MLAAGDTDAAATQSATVISLNSATISSAGWHREGREKQHTPNANTMLHRQPAISKNLPEIITRNLRIYVLSVQAQLLSAADDTKELERKGGMMANTSVLMHVYAVGCENLATFST